jgi:hypothetical protein
MDLDKTCWLAANTFVEPDAPLASWSVKFLQAPPALLAERGWVSACHPLR